MKFTFFAFVLPLILAAMFGAGTNGHRLTDSSAGFGIVVFAWLFIGFWASVVYWIARVWQRGKTDSASKQHTGLNLR